MLSTTFQIAQEISDPPATTAASIKCSLNDPVEFIPLYRMTRAVMMPIMRNIVFSIARKFSAFVSRSVASSVELDAYFLISSYSSSVTVIGTLTSA